MWKATSARAKERAINGSSLPKQEVENLTLAPAVSSLPSGMEASLMALNATPDPLHSFTQLFTAVKLFTQLFRKLPTLDWGWLSKKPGLQVDM